MVLQRHVKGMVKRLTTNELQGMVRGDACGELFRQIRCGLLGREEAEIDASVAPVLHKVGMGGEVVVLAVLEYEQSARLEQPGGEHKVGHGG